MFFSFSLVFSNINFLTTAIVDALILRNDVSFEGKKRALEWIKEPKKGLLDSHFSRVLIARDGQENVLDLVRNLRTTADWLIDVNPLANRRDERLAVLFEVISRLVERDTGKDRLKWFEWALSIPTRLPSVSIPTYDSLTNLLKRSYNNLSSDLRKTGRLRLGNLDNQ